MSLETALVVDDSKSARIMLSRMLQKMGLTVDSVESGEDAISYLEANSHPQVIFMDHMMPGMDGLEATRQISANDATRNIPIFMYTSKEGPEYEASVVESGATGMLGKPAKPDRLKEIIAELSASIVAEPEEPIEVQAVPSQPTTQTQPEEPAVEETEQEEPMSKELIEEVSSALIAKAIQDALAPISDSLNRLESTISEQAQEIKAISTKQASMINVVSQPVLDASLKQLNSQLQQQIESEVGSIKAQLSEEAEISADVMARIEDAARQAGAKAGTENAEHVATSSAEAVAAKVGAAQAQVQLQQELEPALKSVGSAKTIAILAILVSGAAIAMQFIF